MGSKAADLAAMELEAPRRALVDFRCARIENSHLVPRIVGPERSESLAPGALAVIHLLRRPTDLQSHRTAITYRLDHRPRPVLVCLHLHSCWKSDTFRSRFVGDASPVVATLLGSQLIVNGVRLKEASVTDPSSGAQCIRDRESCSTDGWE